MSEAKAKMTKLGKNWTAVPNEILNDTGLSFGAKALWAYVWSKPKGWQYSVAGAAAQTKDTNYKITLYAKELEQAGYLKRIQSKNSRGVFGCAEWLISPKPDLRYTDNGKTDERKTDERISVNGSADDGELHTSKTISSKTKESKTIKDNTIEETVNAALVFFKDNISSGLNIQTQSHRKLVRALLKTYKLEDIKDVLVLKKSEWGSSTVMKSNLKPKTLFRMSNFDNYMIDVRDKRSKGISMDSKLNNNKLKKDDWASDYI